MAIQEGLIQLTGRLGNLTFYKTDYGHAVRRAGGIDAEKIRTHPNFARTRESAAEFGEAMKCIKLFRTAFRDAIKRMADGGLTNRLSSLFVKLVQQDTVNARGSRKLQAAATAALEGLEFNIRAPLAEEVRSLLLPVIDRSTGSLSVSLAAGGATPLLSSPPGATHLVMTATASEIDFQEYKYVSKTAQSEPIPLNSSRQESTFLSCSIPDSKKPLFLAFGQYFVQMINGVAYPLKERRQATMNIVKVDVG